jgi:NAD(P)H-nitrite reductase large subunit
MPQAIVDPAELRRFALMLKKFNQELGERMSAMGNQLNDLTNSWRDQEQLKFRTEFEQHMKMIARFIEANNQHIPYLPRKAERIEEYMQQR